MLPGYLLIAAAAFFWMITYAPTHWRGYTTADWGGFAVIALGALLLPFGCYYWGLRYLRPTRAIITATLEPVFAIVSSGIVLGDSLPPVRWLGAACVLGAIILLQQADAERPTPS